MVELTRVGGDELFEEIKRIRRALESIAMTLGSSRFEGIAILNQEVEDDAL